MLTDTRRLVTMSALSRLTAMGETLSVARQNYVEFRSVATRPANVNGLGMTPEEADSDASDISARTDTDFARSAVY